MSPDSGSFGLKGRRTDIRTTVLSLSLKCGFSWFGILLPFGRKCRRGDGGTGRMRKSYPVSFSRNTWETVGPGTHPSPEQPPRTSKPRRPSARDTRGHCDYVIFTLQRRAGSSSGPPGSTRWFSLHSTFRRITYRLCGSVVIVVRSRQ